MTNLIPNLIIDKTTATVIEGSCTEPLPLLEGNVNLIVTSPPYNLGIDYGEGRDDLKVYNDYLEFNKAWMTNCYKWLSESGRFCLNICMDNARFPNKAFYSDFIQTALSVGFNYKTTIVWAEGNATKRTAWGSFMRASAPNIINTCEVILVFYKGDSWKRQDKGVSTVKREDFITWTNGTWKFKGENRKRLGHPAPFPRELPRRCIQMFSYENDLVLDPFSGSGTTLLECLYSDRNGIGIEISKEYVDLSIKRLNEYSGEKYNE